MRNIYLPDPILLPYILYYLKLEIEIGQVDRNLLCSFPHGACIMNIFLSDELPELRLSNNFVFKNPGLFSGIITSGLHVANSGRFSCMMIFFSPNGAYRLFGIPQSEFLNKILLPGTVSSDLENIIEKIRSSENDHVRVLLLDEYFKIKLYSSKPITNSLNFITDYIHHSKGVISIDQVISQFNITSRTLDRHFNIFLGLPPKVYANLVRLGTSYQMLMNKKYSIHDVIYLLGYYDQSHFTKEFKRYADISPTEFILSSQKTSLIQSLSPFI